MKRLAILILTALMGGSLMAQTDLDHFDGIKSVGSIPQDMKLSLSELYGQDKQRARDYNDGKLKNRDQVLEASYHINRLMASGRILYGDPLTQMLNRIADTLMKDYPELRKELRIYTVKSADVNAFATGQGMIFVTTGLLAQVEDEAQLAFVLSHETIHYYKKHAWENITKKQEKMADPDDPTAKEDETRNFIKYHNRSREMENEADQLGIEMFYAKSPYDKGVTDGFFDVLQYGYLPLDEVVIPHDYYNTPYYQFSDSYFLEKVKPITARDDYDDSKSTHPNILKRRERCKEMLKGLEGGQRFVTCSQQEFEQLRDLARLECIRQDLIYADYAHALYNIMVMQRYMPDNEYLAKAKAEALYSLSKYRNYTNSNEVVGDWFGVEGEMQQEYYFFHKIQPDELSMLAVRELWKAKALFPNDSLLAAMTEDAIKDLSRKNNLDSRSFSDVADTAKSVKITSSTDTQSDSKYAKIKQKQRMQDANDPKRHFFTDLMQGSNMKQYIDSCLAKADDTLIVENEKSGNMLVYAAEYYVGRDDVLSIRKSDRMEHRLVGYLKDVARKDEADMVDFSDAGLRQKDDAQAYNDFVALNEWVNEFWQSKGRFARILTQQKQLNSLADRHDANRINLTTVVNLEGTAPWGARLVAMAWLPFTWPFIPMGMVSGWEHTGLQSIYVDVSTGRLISGTQYTYPYADSKALIEGSIYDNMLRGKGIENATYMKRHLLASVDMVAGINQLDADKAISISSNSCIQFRPRANVEYLINNHNAVQASAMVTKSSVTINQANYGEAKTPADYLNLTLGYHHYRDLAPLGNYWGVHAVWTHITMGDEVLTLEQNGIATSPDDPGSMNKIGLRFTCGRNYIFADRLVMNIGMDLGATICDFDRLLKGNESLTDSYILKESTKDVWLQNIFCLKIGLGVLPF